MTPDERVNTWLITRWIDQSLQNVWPGARTPYKPATHGPVEHLKVITADAAWECGCYSEYTRDDEFILKARIMTKAEEVEFEYGRYGDFPNFIEELSEFEATQACPYENDED